MAEDITQEVLAGLIERYGVEYAFSQPVANFKTCVRNRDISAHRSYRHQVTLHEDGAIVDAPVSRSACDSPALLPHVVEELEHFLGRRRLRGKILTYLFANSILFAKTPLFQRRVFRLLAARISGGSSEYLTAQLGKIRITPRSRAQAIPDRILAEVRQRLERHGLVLGDLYEGMMRPDVLLRSKTLFNIAAQAAGQFVSHIQEVAERHGIEAILNRPGALRSTEEAENLAYYLSLLCAGGQMPREYLLLGCLACLQRNGVDIDFPRLYFSTPERIEHQLLRVLIADGRSRSDRWVALIALAKLHQEHEFSITNLISLLEPVEKIVGNSQILRLGTAFAWMNLTRTEHDTIYHRKVVRLIPPSADPPSLAILPMAMLAPFMGQGITYLATGLKELKLYELLLRGLSSGSQAPVLGAFFFMRYFPRRLFRRDLVPDLIRAVQAQRPDNPLLLAYQGALLENFK